MRSKSLLMTSIFLFITMISSELQAEQIDSSSTKIGKTTMTQAAMVQSEKNALDGQKFLEENKQNPQVNVLSSGLQYQILQEGDGQSPSSSDFVTVHYKGTLLDGTEFDSSYARREPSTFPVNAVIPGWTEALQLMKPGAKWKVFIPAKLAYGTRGAGRIIGPNATLIFEIELLNVTSNLENHLNAEISDEDAG